MVNIKIIGAEQRSATAWNYSKELYAGSYKNISEGEELIGNKISRPFPYALKYNKASAKYTIYYPITEAHSLTMAEYL